MADILKKTTDYGISQSLIDTLAFWGVNTIGHKVTSEIPKPGMGHTIIFLGSDILIRNDWMKMWREKFVNEKNERSISMDNSYIAFTSFVFGTIYDLIKDKEFSKAFADNLILNGLGLIANIGVDNLMYKDSPYI